MKKIFVISLILLLFPLLFYILFPYCVWKHPFIVYRGNAIVRTIEEYKCRNQSFPPNLNELNISAEKIKGFFYEIHNDDRYIIWIGTTLGESIQFDSTEGKWRFSSDN